MESENGRNPKMENLPSEKPVGRNLEIADLYGATCFYKEIKKDG
jgi:hypothetical protein